MSLSDLLARVTGILDEAGIPYMLTGSLAAAYYARPRATRDIDLVVAGSLEQMERLVERLELEGFYVSRAAAREAVRQRGQFNAIDPEGGWKVDLIVRRERPFSRSEFERRRETKVMGLVLWLATPEDLIVAKLEWAQRGASELQLRDALAILEQEGSKLDRRYIERWVGELGLEPEWDRIIREFNPREEP